MEIDPQMSMFMQEMRQGNLEIQRTLGRLEEGQSNLHGYIGAVSSNGKETEKRLDVHIEDDGAHGLKTTQKILGGIVALLTLVMGGIELWRAFIKH